MRLSRLGSVPFVVLLLSLVARGQVQDTVYGTVRYEDTGRPAAGIRIWLAPAEGPTGIHPDPKTGEYVVKDKDTQQALAGQVAPDGTFAIGNVPPGSYLVHTFSPPYITPDDTVFPTSNTAHVAIGPSPSSNALKVTVIANHRTEPVALVLRKGGTIAGTVRLSPSAVGIDRASLAGIAVNAERKLGSNSYARVGGAAHTDAQGNYRLEGLAPGSYIVFLGMGGGLPVYAPETVRPSQASVVQIEQSETQRLDIVLPPAGMLHKIEGSLNAGGAQIPRDVLVRLYPAGEGGLTASSRLSTDHSFSFQSVPDGDYMLEVAFPPTSDIVSIDAAAGVIHMRMTPSPYAAVTQEIQVTGQDVTGVVLTASETRKR
jgi:hypothetical protein